MNLVSLDPGVRAPAVAYFEGSRLTYTCAVKIPTRLNREKNQAERIRQIGNIIVSSLQGRSVDRLVYELMEVYSNKRRGAARGPQKRADPNDLIKVATLAGVVAGRLDVPSVSYLPKEWLGGSTSKNPNEPWASARGSIARNALSKEEFALVEHCTHDELDAICIGLFELGRFKHHRVLPGAV